MSTHLAVTEVELQQLLHLEFIRHYGFVLQEIADGECTLRVPFQKAFERPGGNVTGLVFMAAADVATWFAIMTKLGKTEQSLTVEMTTKFLAGARHEDFRCTARVLKLGKHLVHGVAECVSYSGKHLTHHSIMYARPDH